MFRGLGVDAQFEDWCIADEQTPDDELQRAMVWACENGADCSKIEANQPCFEPNTIKDHASFAFNSYFQRMKAKGATCYFNSAALVTDLDPRHGIFDNPHLLLQPINHHPMVTLKMAFKTFVI
ncbi:hypothetical protein R6Q59_001880 [Mikania micrantha]